MWFTTKVRYEKTRENGSLKTITEPYLVDAPFIHGGRGPHHQRDDALYVGSILGIGREAQQHLGNLLG